MEVGKLERAAKGEDQGNEIIGGGCGRQGVYGVDRVGGDAAGEWGIVMDVEFEEVEQWVVDFGNRAIDICMDQWRQIVGVCTREEGLPFSMPK